MTKFLGAATTALISSLLWTSNALAFGGFGGGDGGAAANPEIDGPGGVMAVALLVSVGAMIYRKARK